MERRAAEAHRGGRLSVCCAFLLAAASALAADDAAQQSELFAGEYRGTRSGLEASLTVTPTLSYDYRQDLGDGGRIRRIARKGDLNPTGPDTANAGRLRLKWRNQNTVEVYSPYGSGIVFDSAGGANTERGRRFVLQRVSGVRASGREIIAKVTLTPTQRFEPECEADVSISYMQMYDRVRVRTRVDHDGCAASSGDYVIRLRTASDDGATDTRSFDETWQRDDAAPLEITSYYDMDPERRLLWARVNTSRKTNCRCLDDAAEPSSPDELSEQTDTAEAH